MTYEAPRIERTQLVALMVSKQSECERHGGEWDGKECQLP